MRPGAQAEMREIECHGTRTVVFVNAGARRAPQALFTAASEAIVAATPKGQLLPNPLEKGTHRTVARAVALAAVNAGVATRDLDADYLVEE